MADLKNYPTPIAGLALGTASLASFWSKTLHSTAAHQILFCGALLVMLLITPWILKFLLHPRELINNLKHPAVGSVVPTFSMTLMVLSQTLALLNVKASELLWLFAICAHISFFVIFSFHQKKSFHFDNFIPSWFIPPIGLVVAAITLPAAHHFVLARNILCFGSFACALLLPAMIYRLIFKAELESAKKPTLTILAAPASVLLSAYLTIMPAPQTPIILLLLSVAVLMTTTVYILLPRLLKLSFTPAFSAFTFPLVISATAMLKVSIWAQTHRMLSAYAHHFYTAALIEGVIATCIVVFVYQHYARFFLKRAPIAIGAA